MRGSQKKEKKRKAPIASDSSPVWKGRKHQMGERSTGTTCAAETQWVLLDLSQDECP